MPISISSNTITFNDLTTQTTSAFTTGAIGNTQLANLAVTSAKLADNAVTAAKLGTTENLRLARAWVNFNGTGTPAIRSSYNVSSITKNGTGDYTVNFATAMADASYSVQALTNEVSTGNVSSGTCIRGQDASSLTTASVRIATGSNSSGGYADHVVVCVQIFGN